MTTSAVGAIDLVKKSGDDAAVGGVGVTALGHHVHAASLVTSVFAPLVLVAFRRRSRD